MSFPDAISIFNRKRKWKRFVETFPMTPTMKILDVGFSEKEYSPVDNFLEKHYPYPENITALGIDTPEEFPQRYPKVRVVQYDGATFPFADASFDVCWSNAVLEHVGDKDRQLLFLREVQRVAKHAFLTTPNKHFPIEIHTRTPLLHFLPKRYFDTYLTRTGKAWATGDYMHLLSARDIQMLLRKAGITQYRIVKNRLLFFPLDFIIIF